MPHHAIGLIDTTTVVMPGSPFYVQGDRMAQGAHPRNLTNVEYEIVAALTNTAGAAAAVSHIYDSDYLGVVSTAAAVVTLREGRDFTGLSGSVWISGVQYTILTVDGATQITLTTSAGTQARALLSTSAPVGTITQATPYGTTALANTQKRVGKCYKRYLGMDLTAISGTGASFQAYCRVF